MRIFVMSLVLAACAMTGCIGRTGTDERRLSALRGGQSAAIETHEMAVNKAKLSEALTGEGATNRIRLVQIYPSAAAVPQFVAPEYRIFDVHQKSAHYLLGLRNADVLVGVNDRVLVDPKLFHDFVRMLPSEKEATIEIRRDGKPILFKYKIE